MQKGELMENSKRFIEAFISIEMYLKNLLKVNYIGFTQMVNQASRKNKTIEFYRLDLLEFAQLRNAITHNRVGDDEAIAEPHDHVVLEIENIALALNKPVLIVDLIDKPVYFAQKGDSLDMILNVKKDMGYSVIPIYHEKQYIGALYDRLFANFFEEHGCTQGKVSLESLMQLRDKSERVIFLSSKASVFDAMAVFNAHHEKGSYVVAILVTENGYPNESPLAILTSADIPLILSRLE